MKKSQLFFVVMISLLIGLSVASQTLGKEKVVVVPLFEQGPPGAAGPGCLGVYDGNDVFLGFLISEFDYNTKSTRLWHVYDPGIPGGYRINMESDPLGLPGISCPIESTWFFASENCTGQAYIDRTDIYFNVMYTPADGGIYFILDTSLPRVPMNQLKSYYQRTDPGNCIPNDEVSTTWMCPIKQIAFPLAGVELAYPITIRQMQ